MKESLGEKIIKNEKEENINIKEKSIDVVEVLLQMKKEQEEIAKEDKIKTPWSHIGIEDLCEEALDAFSAFNSEDIEISQVKIEELKAKIDGIKNKKEKASNENFAKWLDDKIDAKTMKAKITEEAEMDNN